MAESGNNGSRAGARMKPKIQETTFTVHDLCCATEEQLIRKRLQGQPGIEALEFNVISHRLKVKHTCDEETISSQLKEIGLPGINEARPTGPANKTFTRVLVSTALSALFFVAGLTVQLAASDQSLSIVLLLCSMLAGGWHIALKAVRAIRSLALEMNALMTVASIGAVILGQYTEELLSFSCSPCRC